MKVKFTLQRTAGPVDLIATVDSATTVGDLATYLVLADPSRPKVTVDDSLTLGLVAAEQLALDPKQPVAESALRSGATVTVSRSGAAYLDPQRSSVAIATIVEGPDAGKEFHLQAGSSIVGREASCEIRLSDTLASRQHARINISDVVEILDMGSANGVLIDGEAVPRAILRSSDVVLIGDTKLSVRMIRSALGTRPGAGPSVGFIRSPRIDPLFSGETFEAPEPPERKNATPLPVITLITPILMGAILYFVTGNAQSLLFIGLSPLMLIGNNLQGRRAKSSVYKRELAAFREDVGSLVEDLAASATREGAARLDEHPSAAICVEAARHGLPLLWTRRPGERGFGQVRLGLGRQPSRTTIEYPRLKRSVRAIFKELQEATAPFHWVESIPVVGDFSSNAIGIAGPTSLTAGISRGIVTQIAALHSPAELAIAVLASGRTAGTWEWLKWLPHTTTPQSPIAARLLASSAASGIALVSELEELLRERKADRTASSRMALLLIIDGEAPVEHSRLVDLAENGPALGIYILWVASAPAELPAACRTYVAADISATQGVACFVNESLTVDLAYEQVDEETALGVARSLAPIVDLGARTEDASDLPRAVSLLSVTGKEIASSADAIIERWQANRSIVTGPKAPPTPPKHAGTLRAVLGKSGVDVHSLDLRSDGPHALVGGTTGSGKSELLQTWILGMAAAHSPQRLTFLLVDYKGGSAFRDCTDLPHTVGLVTDLSPHLVRRALTSLSAELKYREHLLALHAAKDLVTMEKQGIADAPPSLVIVVDEFAALVKEVPEFVDGVVNVAQRGRSLGLHLILATQRPQGVIRDNLRANTNLRLALRMSDENDSADVLGSPDAAFFDPSIPGRAVSKTGPKRLVQFQAGYVGGWTSDVPPPPQLVVEEFSVSTSREWLLPEVANVLPVDPGPTDIRRVVDRISEACELAEIPRPRQPWLPELRPLFDLADQAAVASRRVDTELVFGVRDDPENQQQPTVAFYPDRDGSLAVYGTSGSGKSALLRTIAIAAAFTFHGGRCQVYGIDFGARGLAMLEELPHVGSIIPGSDHERITRLIAWLRSLIDERAIRYSRVNAGTITDYRTLGNAPDEARIILLVDGITTFRSAYETSDRIRWFDMFTSIVSDGRPVGIHVVLSSDQRMGLTMALTSAVQSRIILRMASPEDYGALGVAGDVVASSAGPGRGVIGDDEIQVAVLGGTSNTVRQAAAIRELAASMRRSGRVPEAVPIRSLPETVPAESLPAAVDELPTLGIASATLEPIGFDIRGACLLTGPPASGRTTALHSLARAQRRADPDIGLYWFGNQRSRLADLDLWSGTATPAEAAEAAPALQKRIADGERLAIFIEGVTDFTAAPNDAPMQALMKQAVNEGMLVVVEGETSTLMGTPSLIGLAKAGRAGIALSPEQSDGSAMYKTPFPRISAADRIPGRAMYVHGGRAELVQLSLPPDE